MLDYRLELWQLNTKIKKAAKAQDTAGNTLALTTVTRPPNGDRVQLVVRSLTSGLNDWHDMMAGRGASFTPLTTPVVDSRILTGLLNNYSAMLSTIQVSSAVCSTTMMRC